MNNELVVDGNEVFDFINYALKFSEVVDIEFRNCDFTNEELLKLIESKYYNRVAFINCTFEDEKLIQEIRTKSLSLTDNKITNYDFVYNMYFLENLTIVGGNVDASKINLIPRLEYLRMSHSNMHNIERLSLENLKYLFIDNTNIKDISFINKFHNLKLLSISEEQEEQNPELIKEKLGHIKIIYDSIVGMEVLPDE